MDPQARKCAAGILAATQPSRSFAPPVDTWYHPSDRGDRTRYRNDEPEIDRADKPLPRRRSYP